MITFTYNGVDFSSFVTVHEITGRGTLSSEVSTVEINGKDGLYAYNKRRKERNITIKMSLQSVSPGALRSFTDVFNELLDLDTTAPLTFSDEPTMTYYAMVVGDPDWVEDRAYAMMTINFLCPNPFKYGPENVAYLNAGGSTILNVGGTVPTKPRFELTATAGATYAMVARDTTQYMMVGREAEIEQEVFQLYETVLDKQGSSTNGWSVAATGEINGTVSGTMTSDGSRLYAQSYGTGDSVWHGPALKFPLPTPVRDFKVDAHVQFHTVGTGKELGRIEIYLLNASGIIVARMAIKDNFREMAKSHVEIQAGDIEGRYLLNEGAADGKSWNKFDGLLRIQRYKNNWTAYAAQIGPNGEQVARAYREWTDVGNVYTGDVAQVVVHIGSYHNWPVIPLQRIRSITVQKINTPVKNDAVPFATSVGDKIVFDHDTGELTRNGEDIRREKNFGGFPFVLEPGPNTLTLMPSGTLSGYVRWRNAYL